MGEKLLRSANGIDRKGFGKGKWKGKGKSWWDWGDGNHNEDYLPGGSGLHVVGGGGGGDRDHITKELPLPSVLANCVPLEAPFGSAPLHTPLQSTARKRGPCRFFA